MRPAAPLLILGMCIVYAHTTFASAPPVPYSEMALAACKTLQHRWFNKTSGTWNGKNGQDFTGAYTQIGWWNAANALEATVNCAHIKNSSASLELLIRRFFDKENVTGIAGSRSYDDSGWVAIAWAKAFQLTGNASYLKRAEVFWQQVQTEGWDSKCGGGLYWAGDKAGGGNRYKNAISNELFLMSSGLLYSITGNQTYLAWAVKEWKWFYKSSMLLSSGEINGGLTQSCKNDRSEGFTYNQGVILGGIAMLHKATNGSDPTLLSAATAIIVNMLKAGGKYTHADGVLREPCEPKNVRRLSNISSVGGRQLEQAKSGCDADQLQFKGVFMRYLAYFLEIMSNSQRKSTAQTYAANERTLYLKAVKFLCLNADAVWSRDRNASDGTFGLNWDGPRRNQMAGAIVQTSALDLLTAAHRVSQLGL